VKADILIQKIENNIDTILNENKYREFLNIVGRFHNYSMLNQLLITLQMPDAHKVAGYGAWNDFGRKVKEGSRGIPILAHKFTNVYIDVESGNRLKRNQMTKAELNRAIEFGLVKKEKVRSGFMGVYVFDISQTTVIDAETEIDDSNTKGDHASVEDIINVMQGITKDNMDTIEYTGDVKTARISVQEAVRLLIDEVIKDGLNGEDKEVVAKSVAYVIMYCINIDISDYKLGFINDWAKNNADTDGYKEKLKIIFEGINKVTRELMDTIDEGIGKLDKYSSEIDSRIVKEELADDLLTLLEARALRAKVYS